MPRSIRRQQRGGSLASENVVQPKRCTTSVPTALSTPPASQAPVTPWEAVTPMRSPSYISSGGGSRRRSRRRQQRQRGGSASAVDMSWFVSTFLAQMSLNIDRGAPADEIVQSMTATWNAQHPTSMLTEASAKQALREFVNANANSTQLVVPVHWLASNGGSFRQSGGGSNPTCKNNPYPYNYDLFGRYRGSVGGSGSTVPNNGMQALKNWFNGETTLFTPSYGSPSDAGSAVKYSCASSGCGDMMSLPMSSPTVDIPKSGSSSATTTVPLFPTSCPAGKSSYDIPIARAGGARRRHQRRRRTARTATKHRRI